MPKGTPVDPALRERALAIYAEKGPAEASRQTGIPRGTISQQARAAGITVIRTSRTREATAAAKLSMEQRRAELADTLLERAIVEAQRLGEKVTERRVSSNGTLVTWEEPEPLPADRRNIAQTLSTLVEKSNLLSGQATARTETLDPAEAREKLAAVLGKRHLRVVKSEENEVA